MTKKLLRALGLAALGILLIAQLIFRKLDVHSRAELTAQASMRKLLTLASPALTVAALGVLVVVQAASATHPRPKSASPLRASLVTAYDACDAPNRTHGPPLAFGSCNPPLQSSTAVTVGTADSNGAAANSVGSVTLGVHVGVPGPPDDSDVTITARLTDIRCQAGTVACGSANAADGADYTGELQGNGDVRIRMTDHFNALNPGGGTDPATMVDLVIGQASSPPFRVIANCVATASTSIGSTCAGTTTANAVLPGAVRDGKRVIVAFGQMQVMDGGPDGVVGTTTDGNTTFARQGVFVP